MGKGKEALTVWEIRRCSSEKNAAAPFFNGECNK
jgi:hypothetical protein